MVFKRFETIVVLLAILLAVTLLAFCWTILQGNLKVTSFNLLVLAALECWYLIYFVKRTNRNLQRFFDSFRNKDSSINFGDRAMGKSFQALSESMNAILQEYSNVQQEREAQYNFFVNAFQQIPVGILVYTQNGLVKLQNKALLQLLKIGPFHEMVNINQFRPDFFSFLQTMKPAQSDVISVTQGQNITKISVRVTDFVVRTESLRLAIFQDVTSELEYAEIESMQKMVRVLTHEIMNSVSPITLASASLIRQYEVSEKDGDLQNPETIKENLAALSAIHKRSKGLTNFVENYRQITRLPQPAFETIEVKQLFQNLEMLLKDELQLKKIQWTQEIVPDNISLLADEKLLEQVMINLIKNSIEALEGCGKAYIRLAAVKFGEQVIIQVEDNGKGIPAEIADQIFTPMFTTKPQGTGIGLSLSRQIIHMHRGTIQVNSEPGVKTVITLRF